jgi:hypothetical protein
MRFKIFILVALLLSAAMVSQGQTRRPTPKPSASPQATAQPSPTPETPAPQSNADELSEAARKDLETQLLQTETLLQLSEIGKTVGVRPTDSDRKLPAKIAAIYGKAVHDNGLANSVMANAFETYSDKPTQLTVRLLFLHAAQNQVLIEQNKKIVQLLTELAKARK